MVLNEKLTIQTFLGYGYACRGVFAVTTIGAGELLWKRSAHGPIRTYSRREILLARPGSLAEVKSQQGERNSVARLIDDRDAYRDSHFFVEDPCVLALYARQIDDDTFQSSPIPSEDVSFFFNHSCEPNCGYNGDDALVALRDIHPGEHVVYDYAFSETEDSLHAGMHCKCGSAACRGPLKFNSYRSSAFCNANFPFCTSYIQRRMTEKGYLSPAVTRRRAHENGGWGLFAREHIRAGQVCVVFSGKIIDAEELLSLPQRLQEMSLQVGPELWQATIGCPHDTGDWINHSCDATCGMYDSATCVAMRDIAVGEEITIDYAMVNNARVQLEGDEFVCDCGTSKCRGYIRMTDCFLPSVQEQYSIQYFSPFVRDAIAARKESDSAAWSEIAIAAQQSPEGKAGGGELQLEGKRAEQQNRDDMSERSSGHESESERWVAPPRPRAPGDAAPTLA